jgi:NADPH:quinone reductase-like Zn-dependent oxidoreductase
VAAGTIPDITSKTYQLDSIVEAHHLLDSGEANGKIVILM